MEAAQQDHSLHLLPGHLRRLAAVLGAGHHGVVGLALLERGQAARRRARREQAAIVIDQQESAVVVGHPDELERNARTELQVRHVLWRAQATSWHACALRGTWRAGRLTGVKPARRPAAAWPELGQRRRRNARPKPVAEGDAAHPAVVQGVRLLVAHGGRIDVYSVVEGVACVALTRS